MKINTIIIKKQFVIVFFTIITTFLTKEIKLLSQVLKQTWMQINFNHKIMLKSCVFNF